MERGPHVSEDPSRVKGAGDLVQAAWMAVVPASWVMGI